MLTIGDFHKNKRTKDGRSSRCKKCAIRHVGEWQRKNPEKVRDHHAKYRLKYPDKYKALHRKASDEWNARNPEKVAASRRRRTAEGRGAEAMRKSYLKHRKRRMEEHQKWLRDHPENVLHHNRKRIEEITPAYAAGLLSHGSDLKPKDFPQELVELKRTHLKIHRQLKTKI